MISLHTEQPKATWLWHTSEIIDQPTKILAFLDENNVSELYLQINVDLPVDIYQNFIEQTTAHHIKVYALDGAPHWAAKQQPLHDFFRWVEKYQSVSTDAQQFVGVHLDIEPYISRAWKSDLLTTTENYQQAILFAEEKSKHLGLHFGIDIPFWFDARFYNNSLGKGVLSEWLIDHSDSLSVMAYRNNARGRNGIIKLSQSEVDYAEATGKQIRIAVETGKSSEGNYLSFYGKNNSYMNTHVNEVAEAFKHHDSFKGIAIHSLRSWMKRQE